MRLVLVRHGQTSSNVRGLLDTAEPGAELTALGHRQARALPRALADERVDAVFASTLTRTQQTAAPLARALGLSVEVRDGLREVSAGDLEMAGDHVAVSRYLGTIVRWAAGDLDARVPGGEDGAAVLRRFDSVVDEVAGGADVAVVVSHGAMIRAWTAARCADVTAEFIAENALSNTGAVVLDGDPSHWRLTRWHPGALGGARLDDAEDDGAAAETLPVD